MKVFPVLSIVFCLGLAACADRSFTPTVPEALSVGTAKTIFAATSREREEDGTFGFGRSEDISLLELTVSIPPNHKPGHLEFAYAKPDPQRQFTMAGRRQFQSGEEFKSRLKQEINTAGNPEREVTVFVHGFNSTQSETTFRAAQLAPMTSTCPALRSSIPGPVVERHWAMLMTGTVSCLPGTGWSAS